MSRNAMLIDTNFVQGMKEAMKTVETMIDNTRTLSVASPDHSHTYDDKFALSEFLTNTALTALLNVFDKMDLDQTKLRQLVKVVKEEGKSVSMRFLATEKCVFVNEEEVMIESPQFIQSIAEETTADGVEALNRKTETRKVVTKIKQFHWRAEIEYSIYLFTGNETEMNANNSGVLLSRTVSTEVVTKTANEPPLRPSIIEPTDVSLTWLLQRINAETLNVEFSINREVKSCRTPKCNRDTRKAYDFLHEIETWLLHVNSYLCNGSDFFQRHGTNDIDLSSVQCDGIFVPVIPIFDFVKEQDTPAVNTSTPETSPILPIRDVQLLLEKQCQTMTSTVESVAGLYASNKFMSSAEAVIVLLTRHAVVIMQVWQSSIQHIENMLCTQLHNAIGKHVTSKDLDEFVRFHNQKLFSDTYAPEPFCYAIRRPGQYPDGLVSIESKGSGEGSNAMTFTRQFETTDGQFSMHIPINSATSVEFDGDLFVHAWMLQRFQGGQSFQLASRARQFSSFLLLVGKLAGPDTFQPEHGIILQNKDEVLIPLLLEEMPSAKEFKDAIESLSPEQQRFAKAFRNMKLSSSVFGVCVIQIKPQIEILLGLPDKSLTKEIRLTQDLLSLFIDYQIPSDLLSYDGADSLEPSAKLEVVKGHVKNVQDMIKSAKETDLKEAEMKRALKEAEMGPRTFGSGSAIAFGSASGDSVFGSARGSGVSKKKSHYRAAPKCAPPPPGAMQTMSAAATLVDSDYDPFVQSNNETERATDEIVNNFEEFTLVERSDLTKLPKIFDAKFEAFGADEEYGGALRSTTISTGSKWLKKSKPNLLAKDDETELFTGDQKTERDKAFDLLDALSRSGSLPLSCAELHVIVASTHCFEKSVVNTIIQDNVNPIEKIERSNLAVASTIHDVKVNELLRDKGDLKRIAEYCPLLLKDEDINA